MAYAAALELYVAAHEAALALIFTSSSSSDAAALVVYDADDVQLAAFALDPAASAVNPATGTLTLATVSATATADATGTASYAQIQDDAGTPLIELPCTEGNTALPGELVLNTLSLIVGGEVEALTVSIPAGDLLA